MVFRQAGVAVKGIDWWLKTDKMTQNILLVGLTTRCVLLQYVWFYYDQSYGGQKFGMISLLRHGRATTVVGAPDSAYLMQAAGAVQTLEF